MSDDRKYELPPPAPDLSLRQFVRIACFYFGIPMTLLFGGCAVHMGVKGDTKGRFAEALFVMTLILAIVGAALCLFGYLLRDRRK